LHSHEDANGLCRRYPPSFEGPKSGDFENDYSQPWVTPEDWCGEHSPRKTLPVVEQTDGKLHFHVSGDNVWRADSGTHSFQIAKEDDGLYTTMMYGDDPVVCSSYETAVAWCETMLRNHGN
jgi:hypothetical protein